MVGPRPRAMRGLPDAAEFVGFSPGVHRPFTKTRNGSAMPDPSLASFSLPHFPSRQAVLFKFLVIALLALLLQIPLHLVNGLREERAEQRASAHERQSELTRSGQAGAPGYNPARAAAEGYRMVERALKHSALIIALTFGAFFLFEVVAGLRLHAVHYTLLGAALCLFYLALLALGEHVAPGGAYFGAAFASSLLVVCYSIAILRSAWRAGVIAALLATQYSTLFVVLRLEDYALLAGTGMLFVALAAIMYFTRHVDWNAQDEVLGTKGRPLP